MRDSLHYALHSVIIFHVKQADVPDGKQQALFFEIMEISGQNFVPPTLVDKNRMERGDFFVKPTAYWFFNCEPTHGFSYQNDKEQKIINKCARSHGDGLCGGERSLMSTDYARNWICDFVLGKKQSLQQQTFDF